MIVVGDEPVIKNHTDRILQKYLKDSDLDQINITVDKSTKIESLQPFFMDGSLFNNHTYFRINVLSGRVPDEVKKFLEKII